MQATAPAVRRSPLETVHAALGARWFSDLERFAINYGSADSERAAVLAQGGLAELGPTWKLSATSGRATPSLEAAGLRVVLGSVHVQGGVEVWGLAPDEVLVVAANEDAQLRLQIQAGGAAVTDMSSAWTSLRLAGPAVPSILAEACAVDLTPTSLAEGEIVQAMVANVRAILTRRDLHDAGDAPPMPGFTLLVARDEAEYLWGALLQLGRGHGLVPVGALAVEDGPS
jgi:heterotetrameric sarcosine oxidase gamma subunit